MFIYRIKQFFWSINAKLTEEDKIFIDSNLNMKEKELYYKLPVYDQKHCINVARGINQYINENNLEGNQNLIKAGLLHDIGKIKVKLNIIDKGILVICDKLSNGKMKRFYKNKKINIYYNHPTIGAKILRENNIGNDNIIFLVENHHGDINNKNLNLLKKFDSIN